MSIYVPSIEVASIEPQPNFPLEDASPENTETLMYMLGVEQRARPDDGRLVGGSDRAWQPSAYLQAMFGSAALHRGESIHVESIELGSKLFDDMIERLTGRAADKLLVVGDDMNVISKGLAQMSLSRLATDNMIADFEKVMPNAVSVVEMASQDYDTRLAKLGAVASRSIALSN